MHSPNLRLWAGGFESHGESPQSEIPADHTLPKSRKKKVSFRHFLYLCRCHRTPNSKMKNQTHISSLLCEILAEWMAIQTKTKKTKPCKSPKKTPVSMALMGSNSCACRRIPSIPGISSQVSMRSPVAVKLGASRREKVKGGPRNFPCCQPCKYQKKTQKNVLTIAKDNMRQYV